MVDWCNLGQLSFTEPFFEQTIARALRNPAQLVFRRTTPIADLEDFDGIGLRPTAFIFHWSRCGSTLVSQMLAAVPGNIVISEAPPFDRVLQAPILDPRITRERQIGWLRGLLGALGRPRTAETRLFVKLDSWHILHAPLLREAFPGVPWIFLYRDPVEILVSHARMPGSHMLPGAMNPRVLGEDWASVPYLPLDDYAARVLARLGEAALAAVPAGGGRLVNYRQLPEAVVGPLAATLGNPSGEERQRMVEACRMNAKDPAVPFAEDTGRKQREATAELRRAAEKWVSRVYERLEHARLEQEAG
jgi:hypothetical protein